MTEVHFETENTLFTIKSIVVAVRTPERIEFANLSMEHVSSDQDESLSQMDEDEWTDKNFGASCAEVADSDEESSSLR